MIVLSLEMLHINHWFQSVRRIGARKLSMILPYLLNLHGKNLGFVENMTILTLEVRKSAEEEEVRT